MAGNQSEMPFWAHVEALRGALLRIAAVVVSLAIVLFAAMPWLFDNVILAPCRPGFPTYSLLDNIAALASSDPVQPFSVNLVNIELATQLFLQMSTAGWLAAVISFPVSIHILWRFVSPGLYPRERHNATTAFICGNIMFYLGVAAGYFIVFPLALRFLATYQLSDAIPNVITIDSYMDNFLAMVLAMGAIFELPLLAWMLGRLGLLTRRFFARYRRHAIVVLLVIAALITPTGDPFTLTVVFLPIYLLWELSAALVPGSTVA